jgi:hypothetical protein
VPECERDKTLERLPPGINPPFVAACDSMACCQRRARRHYLGHKNIQHTVRYTELSPDRFRDFWRD